MPAIVKLVESADDSRFLILPATPSEVPDSGEAVMRTYAIDGSGSFSFPNGRAEKKFPLSGTFPGPGRAQLPYVHDWRPPIDLVRQISNWCDDGVELMLFYDSQASNNSWPVFVERYQFSRVGAYGDVSFTVECTELRQPVITIDTTTTGSATESQAVQATPQSQSVVGGSASTGAEPPVPANYTVQPGDTLSIIAKKLLGDSGRWKEIWEINPLGDGPDLIYPGLILLIPGADTRRTDLPADLLLPEPVPGQTGPF